MLEPMTLDRETRIRVNLGVTTEVVPMSCAVEKPKYIANRHDVIAEMDKTIKELEAEMAVIADVKSDAYKAKAKKLAKCREIKKNCEFSIKLATEQMEIEKRARARIR